MTNILNGAKRLILIYACGFGNLHGACSEKFEDIVKKMVKAASEVNQVLLLNYLRKEGFCSQSTYF